MPKRLLPWMALCACSPLLAAPTVPEARLQQLAADPYWIALGHYERGKLGGWRSYVDDERFFLADNGESHPDAELAATLKALYASPSLGDKHAQCVYPARTRWLRQQLQLDDLPQPQCGEYDNWYRDINPHSAVLVFPAAYLNSPSSMFGHTLLRIDQADVTSNNTALLSYALNFGAYIEGMDNSILYAWKGLMGGYPGLFALVPYREKLAEYSRLENRDLWEYKLNLTPEETGRMVEHVWELKQVRFDYYFFDENCSFRLLELMEIARPGIELTEQFPLTAIPTDTVRAVKNAGLIERIDYRPSREKELLARAEPLDHAERDWAKRLADDDSLLDAPDFKALPMPRQALIQDAAFRLVRYRATGQARDSGIASRSYNLLRAINRNPPPDLQVERPGQPEDGHESRTWQFGVGSRDDRAFAEYGLRMAYHDLADNAYGFPLGAQIEIGQLKLRQYEGNRWQLQNLDLVTIRSLTPRNQLLKPLSWQVAGGLERVPGEDGDENLVSHLNGGAGGSWMFGDDLLLYAMGTARIENNRDFAAAIAPAVGFDSGLLWRNPLGNLTPGGQGRLLPQRRSAPQPGLRPAGGAGPRPRPAPERRTRVQPCRQADQRGQAGAALVLLLSQPPAHLHQGEAEQVEALPGRRLRRQGIARSQADAPDRVHRAGLDQHPVGGAQKVFLQRSVLAELAEVAFDHDSHPLGVPACLVEAGDFAAEGLRLAWAARRQDALEQPGVVEQACLGRHHVMLGAGVAHPVELERSLVPLAETALADLVIRRRTMSPEIQVLEAFAGRAALAQPLDVHYLAHRHSSLEPVKRRQGYPEVVFRRVSAPSPGRNAPGTCAAGRRRWGCACPGAKRRTAGVPPRKGS